MSTRDELKSELENLVKKETIILSEVSNKKQFGKIYQEWYSSALKIVQALAPDRLEEFKSCYLRDSKREKISRQNYTIQDYLMGIKAPLTGVRGHRHKAFDEIEAIQPILMSQLQILASLESRIDNVLQDVTGGLLAEIQDRELTTAQHLIGINLRAAGAVAGVVLEGHLQQVAKNHSIPVSAKATLANLNDPLKNNGVYKQTEWRKIQHLTDLRNLCCHKDQDEPTKEQVIELIQGVDSIVKTVY